MEQKIMNLEDYRLAKKCIIKIQQLEEKKKRMDEIMKLSKIVIVPESILTIHERECDKINCDLACWNLQLEMFEREWFGLEKVSDSPEDDVKFDQRLSEPVGEKYFAKLFEQIVSAGKEESK